MSGTFPGTCICVWSKNNILLIFIHTHRIGCSTCLDCADLITSNPQNPHKVRYCNIIIIIIITLHTSTFNYSTVRYVVSCRVVSCRVVSCLTVTYLPAGQTQPTPCCPAHTVDQSSQWREAVIFFQQTAYRWNPHTFNYTQSCWYKKKNQIIANNIHWSEQ